MLTCLRCGDRVPRLTVAQIHCLPCARDVAELIQADERRRAPRFTASKSLDPWAPR